jgi:serine/threonine protein kinase
MTDPTKPLNYDTISLTKGNFRRFIHQTKNDRKDFYFEKKIGKYHVLKKIGSGRYGLVKLGENKETHQKVAIKIIDKSFLDVVEKNSIITEAEVMTYLRHPNVIQLYEVIENEKEICMIMEYAAGGDLYDFVCKSKGKKLKESDAKRLFQQIVSGVAYCHRHYIVHRDLKAENIFLDEMNNVKIGDWGFSSEFHPGSKMETYCGSLDYAAPEVLSGVAYVGPEVDIWSLGVLLYFMVCGKLPFRTSNNDYEVYQNIKNAFYQLPNDLSPECKDLIRRILNPNPKLRAKMIDIEKHPWLEHLTLRPTLRSLASSSNITASWNPLQAAQQVHVKRKRSISDTKLEASIHQLRTFAQKNACSLTATGTLTTIIPETTMSTTTATATAMVTANNSGSKIVSFDGITAGHSASTTTRISGVSIHSHVSRTPVQYHMTTGTTISTTVNAASRRDECSEATVATTATSLQPNLGRSGANKNRHRRRRRSTGKSKKHAPSLFETILEKEEIEEAVILEPEPEIDEKNITNREPNGESKRGDKGRSFSILKLNADEYQEFKRLRSFEVLEVKTVLSPRYIVDGQRTAASGARGLDSTSPRSYLVVAAKKSTASTLKLLKQFELRRLIRSNSEVNFRVRRQTQSVEYPNLVKVKSWGELKYCDSTMPVTSTSPPSSSSSPPRQSLHPLQASTTGPRPSGSSSEPLLVVSSSPPSSTTNPISVSSNTASASTSTPTPSSLLSSSPPSSSFLSSKNNTLISEPSNVNNLNSAAKHNKNNSSKIHKKPTKKRTVKPKTSLSSAIDTKLRSQTETQPSNVQPTPHS